MATSGNRAAQITKTRSQDRPSERAAKNETGEKAPPADKRPSLVKRARDSLGLSVELVMLLTKGALPPTISLAMYQSTSFADTYSTLGYLVAIMSVLSFTILPRSKFLQTMLLNVIAVCLGSAFALLAIYCSVQARAHTTPPSSRSSNGPSPGASVAGYNSSASAICAIWLFFNIYFVNTLRASRPQFQFPVIMYSIFADVALTYAPTFPTMATGISFAKSLLESFMTGFAISAGVSLFIFPMTVRMGFFKQSMGFIKAIQSTLQIQIRYLQSLENKDVFRAAPEFDRDIAEDMSHEHRKAKNAEAASTLEAQRLKAAIGTLGEMFGKMHADVAFAKREMAFGKLNGSDIDELFKLFQGTMLPLMGMGSVADIFGRVAQKWAWTEAETAIGTRGASERENSERAKVEWNEIMKTLHGPFQAMTEIMHDGLQHTLYALELTKAPKAKKTKTATGVDETLRDVEADAGVIRAGNPQYAAHFSQRIEKFYKQREKTLAAFCEQKGIKMEVNPLSALSTESQKMKLQRWNSTDSMETHSRNKRQLYLILHMEFLMWSTGGAILRLVQFADRKVEDGSMKKKRLIVPGRRRIRKWFLSLLNAEDVTTEHTPDSTESGAAGVSSGSSFQDSKDPEHLPPTNVWQRFGNRFRKVGGVLASPESAFGFRVGCATLSIGIVAYLKDTHDFFLTQRLVWALIMVSIGMTVTAGSGVFGFFGRIAGTFVAMCMSLAIWYIVNGHAAGVLVFLFVFIFIEFYLLLKYPRFSIVALLSIVTQVLIIGYELQVKKVGAAVATSNGQPYYQIFLLAPYRLACVSGGMFVAFFWTFFPYPLTARSQLRKDLGVSLYLLANFYSIVHTTVELRISGRGGDLNSKKSPGRRLGKARSEVYIKELTLLAALRQHSAFTAWEPSFGGRFPRQQYDAIIQEVENILNYMMLISYASNNFTHDFLTSPNRSSWIQDFARLLGSVNTTSQEITSTLALLSASVTNGTPLPPYLKPPEAYKLSARLEEMDADILNISHITEPGYSAFAVLQIASRLVSDDLGKLIENVKALVGEVDFSFHVISTSTGSEEALLTNEDQKGKGDRS